MAKNKLTSVEEAIVEKVSRTEELRQDYESSEVSTEIPVKELTGVKVVEDESLDNSQQTIEEKSDDATSVPDDESAELPVLLELEVLTKDGIKRFNIYQGYDPLEVAIRIAQDNGLTKEVEEAIEYKIMKAIEEQE